MFTGLIDDRGEIISVQDASAGRRLRIVTDYDSASLKIGASIACSGACLTVVEAGESRKRRWFDVEVSSETLSKTTLTKWKEGSGINLERALKFGDPFGGHIVTGHVDGIARVISRTDEGGSARFVFSLPQQLAHFVAAKGSAALDGVSLTVNEVKGNEFGVMIIPHTQQVTGFGALQANDEVNFEADLIARYVARLKEF